MRSGKSRPRRVSNNGLKISAGKSKSDSSSETKKRVNNSSDSIKFSAKPRLLMASRSRMGLRSNGKSISSRSSSNSSGCRTTLSSIEFSGSRTCYASNNAAINSSANNRSIISKISYEEIRCSRISTGCVNNNSIVEVSFLT